MTQRDSNPWPLRCRCSALTNLATKSHSWEQVNLLGSCFPVKDMKSNEDMIRSARIISSFDFKHRTSYNISFIRHSFHGKTWAQQIDLLQMCDFVAQLVRALHRHRHHLILKSRGHGFESRWIPLSHLNLSGSWDNCLNCPASARIISSFEYLMSLCPSLVKSSHRYHMHLQSLLTKTWLNRSLVLSGKTFSILCSL